MKLMLIQPSRVLPDGRLLKKPSFRMPGLALPYLAAFVPREDEVSLVNELLDDIDFDRPVHLVGISVYSSRAHRAYQIADEFRRRSVYVVLGGIHVSMEPEEALEHADTVIAGEADETWPQFLADFRRGQPRRLYRAAQRPSLEHLPVPRFDLLDRTKYRALQQKGLVANLLLPRPLIPVQTARGCPHDCDFCAVTAFCGGTYRARPVAEVVAELRAQGARSCFFVDDNIFAQPARARELFEAIRPLRLRWFGQASIAAGRNIELVRLAARSGCGLLFLGVESLSPAALQAVNKTMNRIEDYRDCFRVFRAHGIGVVAGMMFGLDGDDLETPRRAYEFLTANRAVLTLWQPLTPLPGTRLYRRLKEEGRLREERWWLKPPPAGWHYDLKVGVRGVDERAFNEQFMRYYRRFYSLRSILPRLFLPPQKRALTRLVMNAVFRRRIVDWASPLEI